MYVLEKFYVFYLPAAKTKR